MITTSTAVLDRPRSTMSPAQFVAKVDSEGGIEEAFLSYGLTPDMLDKDADPALHEAVTALHEAYMQIAPLVLAYEVAAMNHDS